jgi:spore germination protein AB
VNRGIFVKLKIPENRKIAPFLVFYIITSSQIGLGVLGFQRIIAKDAGTDSWISIIIGGILLQILMICIYKMLNIVKGDWYDVHAFIFGEKISKIFSLLLAIYACFKMITVLRGYIEIVQVWMFHTFNTFKFGLAFLLLSVYIVYGGFRTIVGINVFSMIILFLVMPLFLYTVPYANPSFLKPVFSHSLGEIFKAVIGISYSYMGYEIILFIYPFLKEPAKSKKWAHFALLFTTLFYLYIAILTFMFFPVEAIDQLIWASLNMWKIIEMPFVERFEYIGIATWFVIMLPKVCLYLWISGQMLKRSFDVRLRTSIPIIASLCLIVLPFMENRTQIHSAIDFVSQIDLYLTGIYIPILFICVLIVWKVKKRGKTSN